MEPRNWMVFTKDIPCGQKVLTHEDEAYNQLVPFHQEEIEKAKDQGFKFGHLFEEKSDELMWDRKFMLVSTIIL